MDTMKWSAEQAMETLKIPESNKIKYLKQLFVVDKTLNIVKLIQQ